MKRIFYWFFAFVSLAINLVNAQGISFDSPTSLEKISGGSSQTLIPFNLTYTNEKHPDALYTSYIKLLAHNSIVQRTDQGGGIQ